MLIARNWKGTVRCTARGARFWASPTPKTCRSASKVRLGLTRRASIKRVTFGSAEVQLPRRAIGFVKTPVERPKQQLLSRKLRSLRVVVSATIIDGSGKRQIIERTVRLRTR